MHTDQAKQIKRKILYNLLAIGMGGLSITLLCLVYRFTPTPMLQRNISTTDVRIHVETDAPNEAIIRTYTTDEYDDTDILDLRRLGNTIDGRTPKDVPCLLISENDQVTLSFWDGAVAFTPEEAPTIHVTTYALYAPYSIENKNVSEGTLAFDGTYKYSYTVHQNLPFDAKAETLLIRIRYAREGVDYVSHFAVHAFYDEASYLHTIEEK